MQNETVPDGDEFDFATKPNDLSRTQELQMAFGAVRRNGLFTLLKLGRRLRKAYEDQQSEEDWPPNVSLNDRSRRIARLAKDLARAGREDDAAVAQIQAKAGHHRDDLRVAALYARGHGLHHESPVMNRAHRLLQAALNNTAVAPPDAADRSRLELVAWFENLTSDGQWAELVSREPQLAELEEDIRSGRTARFLPPEELSDELRLGFKNLRDEHRQALTDWGAAAQLGIQRLENLVGPRATTGDELVRTMSAFESAWGHMHSI